MQKLLSKPSSGVFLMASPRLFLFLKETYHLVNPNFQQNEYIFHLKSKGVPSTFAISPVGMRASEMGVYLSALRVTKWSWMELRPNFPARLK